MAVDEALATSCVSIWRYYTAVYWVYTIQGIQWYTIQGIQWYTIQGMQWYTIQGIQWYTIQGIQWYTIYRICSDTLYSDTLYRVYTIQDIHYTEHTLYRVSNDESIVFCGSHVILFEFFSNEYTQFGYIIYNFYLLYRSCATNSQIIFLDHLIEEYQILSE